MTNRAIGLSARLYRSLLRLYPAKHLAEYGEEMAQCFEDLCREEGLVAAWGRIVRDLPASVIREHRTEGRMIMSGIGQALRRKVTSEKFVKDAAQTLSWWAAVGVLFASVNKLTSLPLTEGQLIIGILAASAVSLQLVILGILATPGRVASSEKR